MNNFWKIRVSVFINYFIFAILLNSVGTVIALSQTYFKVDEKQVSFLDPFKDISIAVAAFLVGGIITKIGYKKSMLAALAAVAVTCFALPSFKYFIAVKLLFAVCGFSFGIIKVAVYGIIGIISKDEKAHLSTMSFIESFFMTGILSGYFIFAYFSKDAASGEWFYAYYILGVLSLVAFLFLIAAPLDESNAKSDAVQAGAGFKEMLALIVLPMIWSFVICAFFYVLIEQSTMNWLPTFNKKVLRMNEQMAIIMGSILSATIMLGRFLAGILFKKFNWYMVLIGCLVGAVIVLLVSLNLVAGTVINHPVDKFGDVPLVAYIFPLIGIFLSPVYPAINSLILSALPKIKHGAMSGLIVVFSAVGGTLGSVITGYLFKQVGGVKAFYFSLIPLCVLAIGLTVFKNFRKKNEANIEGEMEMINAIGH